MLKLKKTLCSILGLLLFTSANLNLQTTADPYTKLLRIKMNDSWLEVNLEAPGVSVFKYPNGTIEKIFVKTVSSSYEIFFYPQRENQIEKIALIKRYKEFNNRLLLSGRTESYNESGRLLVDSNWEEGALHGKQFIYNSDGQLVEKKEYEKGYPINTWITYFQNGRKALEIEFPPSLQEWLNTQAPGRNTKSSALIDADYYSPLIIKEKWFSPYGYIQKEKEYSASCQGYRFFMRPTGYEVEYNKNGRVMRKILVKTGKLQEVERIPSVGRDYIEKKTWYGDELFKKTELIIKKSHSVDKANDKF